MYKISGITQDPLQKQTLILPDGNSIGITLYFMEQANCWMIRELNYNNSERVINNIRVVNSYNFLNQYRNSLSFGMSCVSVGDREPQFIGDFSTQQSILYILTSSEVEAYSESLKQ